MENQLEWVTLVLVGWITLLILWCWVLEDKIAKLRMRVDVLEQAVGQTDYISYRANVKTMIKPAEKE